MLFMKLQSILQSTDYIIIFDYIYVEKATFYFFMSIILYKPNNPIMIFNEPSSKQKQNKKKKTKQKKKKKQNNTFDNNTSAKNQLIQNFKKSRISLKYMYEVVFLYNFTDVK